MPSPELLHAGLDRLSLALQGQPLTTPPLDLEVTAEEVARVHAAIHGRSVDLAVVERALRQASQGEHTPEASAPPPPVVPERPTAAEITWAKSWAWGTTGLTLTYMIGGFAFAHELVSVYPIHLALSMTLGMTSGRLLRRWMDLKEKAAST